MKIVVQKCIKAKVTVDDKIISEIKEGLLLLVGFKKNEENLDFAKIAQKIVNLRIFNDENNVMNKSLLDVKGKILSVSQFTLYADPKKGNRPSYINALSADEANILYQKFNEELEKYVEVKQGLFGADMQVSLINNGPTTIILEY